LRCFLKAAGFEMARSCCDSWLQTCGLAKEKARSPNLVDSQAFTFSSNLAVTKDVYTVSQ